MSRYQNPSPLSKHCGEKRFLNDEVLEKKNTDKCLCKRSYFTPTYMLTKNDDSDFLRMTIKLFCGYYFEAGIRTTIYSVVTMTHDLASKIASNTDGQICLLNLNGGSMSDLQKIVIVIYMYSQDCHKNDLCQFKEKTRMAEEIGVVSIDYIQFEKNHSKRCLSFTQERALPPILSVYCIDSA